MTEQYISYGNREYTFSTTFTINDDDDLEMWADVLDMPLVYVNGTPFVVRD